jgi:glycosyltransferase involved in cell wall biosynthesis
MDQTRNVDASRFFVEKILPRLQDRGLDVTYYIVGQNPTDEIRRMEENPGVVVTGTVDDVRPFLERSSVVVAPYRMGSGVKHKIPIAFSMGKPVVATPNACQGIEVTHGENVMIAKEPKSFADAIQALLESEDRRRALGKRAQSFIREEYSWDAILSRLLADVEKIVEGKAAPVENE